jgi:hypothetical protein
MQLWLFSYPEWHKKEKENILSNMGISKIAEIRMFKQNTIGADPETQQSSRKERILSGL